MPKEKRREYDRVYREKNKEKIRLRYDEYNRRRREKSKNDEEYARKNRERANKYRLEHLEEILIKDKERRKAHKEEYRERNRIYRENNKEKIKHKDKERYEAHKEEISARKFVKEENAKIKESSYRYRDKKRGFNTDNNVTKEWILENIFNGQVCVYCGESDWTKLGCDRIDNSKPHTPDNVVCSCVKCNKARGSRMSVEEFKQTLKQ